MYLILKGQKPKPIYCACHRPGPEGLVIPMSRVFICEACIDAAEAHTRALAVTRPDLRDHRLKEWKTGCDCDRCQRKRAAV